jgi:uncharacterized protein YkwD
MRKPLVVACVATAVLLAGGVAATTADAEQAPIVPGVPGFVMPELPGLPQFPGTGDAGDVTAGDDDSGDDQAGGTGGQLDPAGGPDAVAAPGRHDAGPGDERPGGGDRTPQRPGGPRPSVTLVPQRPDVEAPADATPAAGPKPAGDGDQPVKDRPRLAQQADGAGVPAAARQNVTAADVSSSPSAPVQQQVLALVNQNRRRGGCDALTLDRRLIDAANEHAADMARHDYFAHESRNGDGAGDRVTGAGYRWKRYGENIARGVDSPYEVVDGWMHSPEHRENILDCRLQEMGIGLALSRDHGPYWVQDFATEE